MRVAAATLGLLLSAPLLGSVTGYSYLVSKFTNVEQLTVSSLPVPDGTQGIRIVLDGSTVEDCAAGGGVEVVLCLDTGTWTAVGSGAGGDITAVGDCTTGDCFQAVTARHSLLGPVGGGVASFRAITEADISDLSHTVDTDDQVASEVPFTPVGGVAATDVQAAIQEVDAEHTVNTDNQTGVEVPYTPTTPADWTDPDPTDAGGALDILAARDVAEDDLTDNSVTDLSDVTAISGNTTVLGTTSGVLTSGNCVEIDVSGNLVDAGTSCGGASSSGTGIQYGDGAGGLSEVTGSSVTGSDIQLGGTLLIPTTVGPNLVFGDGDAGFYQPVDDSIRLDIVGPPLTTYLWDRNRFQVFQGGGVFNATVEADAASATNPVFVPDANDLTTGVGWAGTSDLRLVAGGVSGLGQTTTATTTYKNQVNSPSTATCTSTGDANPGAVTITPTTSNVLIDNNDPDGCAISLSETGAVGGQQLELTLTETAGGAVTLADSVGVTELSGGTTFTFSTIGDGILLTYHDLAGTVNDAWYERSRTNL